MPTGYTNVIKDGITFEQFVFRCARAMGALVTMRDAPADAKIPDRFEPSDYYVKKIAEVELEYQLLESLSPEEVKAEADKEYFTAVGKTNENISNCNYLRGKYKEMLCKVKAWQPPTADHVEFKSFMIRQIEESIEHDCNTDYYINNFPQLKTAEIWLGEKRKELARSLSYYSKEHVAEISRAVGRTAWIQALKKSLK